MNIIVRDLNPIAVKRIEELAKKKGVSRSVYLKQIIEARAILMDVEEENTRYEKLVQNCVKIIGENTLLLEQLKILLERSSYD